LVWDENIYMMVLKREFFASFTDKQVGHAATAAQFQLAFSRDSRQDVDALIEAGVAAGGSEHGELQDYGFMYAAMWRTRTATSSPSRTWPQRRRR
jgi:predicted lactoylglutathione lyase